MTFEEAEVVRAMIDGHWGLRMTEHTATLWLEALLPEDANEATVVVAHLAQKMHYAPKIVDFKEVMRLLHPPKERPQVSLPEGKRGYATPEWVWVWSWARWRRDPIEERSFPQQDGHVDPTDMLTMAEYEALRDEWLEAKSPKAEHPIPMAR